MTISKDVIKQTIKLAKIEYSKDKIDSLTQEMDRIVELVEILDELDTSNVKPTYHGIDLQSVIRKDKPINTINRQSLLDNAPNSKDGYIQVPAVMNEGGGA